MLYKGSLPSKQGESSMKPRLKSSKKWTLLPPDFIRQIQELYEKNFKDLLDDQDILIEGRIYPEEILLRVGLRIPESIRQSNFEVSLEYSAEKDNAIEMIHVAVDAAASMMAEHLENPDEIIDFPEVWQKFPFENHEVYLQFNTINSDLEAQANALLGEKSPELFNEEEEDIQSEDLYDTDPEDDDIDFNNLKPKADDDIH